LEPDFADYTNRAVLAIVAHLNATDMGFMDDLRPDLYHAPPLVRAVNAVWFVSLTLALAVSLIAILVKQWLVEFTARMRKPVASARVWAQRHAIYRTAFDTWHIGAMVSSLSFMLHIALLLFLVGLIGMLFDIDSVSFGIVLGLTLLLTLFYGAATFMPLIYGDCPSYTPLLGQFWEIFQKFRAFASFVRLGTGNRVQASWEPELPSEKERLPPYDPIKTVESWLPRDDTRIVRWMASNLHTPEEVEVTIAAMGVISMQWPQGLDDNSASGMMVFDRIKTQPCEELVRPLSDDFFLQTARALRTCISTFAGGYLTEIFDTPTFRQLLRCSVNDVSLLAQIFVAIQHEHFHSQPLVTFDAIETELDRWSVRFPGQLPARIGTLRILVDVPHFRNHTPDESNRQQRWDISCAVGLQLATVIDNQHSHSSPEAQLAQHFAQRVMSESSSGSSLFPEKAHGYVYLLIAWSALLEMPDHLGVSENRVTAITRCYLNQLARLSLMPSVYVPQAELVLGYLVHALRPGSDNIVVREWTVGALIGATTVLQQRLSSSENMWSSKAGAILFNICMWQAEHCTEANDRSQIARSFGKFFRAVNQITPPHRDIIRALEAALNVGSLIQESFLNLLMRRQCSDNQSNSTWRLAVQAGVKPKRLSGLAARLAIELSILSRVGHDVTALAEELVVEHHGVPLIIASGLYGFEMALHLREILPSWWPKAREEILASSREKWTDGEPTAFVSAVEAESAECTECTAAASSARKYLRKRKSANRPGLLARLGLAITSPRSRRSVGEVEEMREKGEGEDTV